MHACIHTFSLHAYAFRQVLYIYTDTYYIYTDIHSDMQCSLIRLIRNTQATKGFAYGILNFYCRMTRPYFGDNEIMASVTGLPRRQKIFGVGQSTVNSFIRVISLTRLAPSHHDQHPSIQTRLTKIIRVPGVGEVVEVVEEVHPWR
jgi:hypothetical protein